MLSCIRARSGWLCSLAALVVAGTVGTTVEVRSETTLTAISNLPTRVVYVRHFLNFVEDVNKRGKGVVQVKYLGGPEVTPTQKQGQALRTGIVDMNYGIASFYKGIIPHVDAMVGATIDAVESRKQGHTEYLDGIWRKRINAHFLAWLSSDAGWYIYLIDKPKMLPDEGIDFGGLKIRSSPSTRDFIQALGANVGLIHSTEVYTALERGVVNGNVFPGIGVTDYGWEKFLKWRIEPQFLQTNAVVMVNLDKWNGLSKEAQDLLQKVAIEHETISRGVIAAQAEEELKKLKAAGMQTIELEGEFREKYLKTARDTFWSKLEKDLPDEVAELKRRFYQ